jgi:Rps23 Pro-64 3,4-dihydroxylase Tpa1-like proline 4-hydroxylase
MSTVTGRVNEVRVLDELLRPKLASRFRELGDLNAAAYQSADPFPHIVIDDFLSTEILDSVLAEFPAPHELDWRKFDGREERKLEFRVAEKMPSATRDLLYFLNSAVITDFLERLTGIDGLIPDPHFIGGGLHQIERGGYLGMHADFNKLEKLRLDRRLNLLLYLNHDWKEEYGGHLELWNQPMTECVRRVLPIFNRCVVFSTTDESWHGHPVPLTCPKGTTRKSVATYYYTNGRPEEQDNAGHSTLFKARPGVAPTFASETARVARKTVRAVLPPVITDFYYYLQRKLK